MTGQWYDGAWVGKGDGAMVGKGNGRMGQW